MEQLLTEQIEPETEQAKQPVGRLWGFLQRLHLVRLSRHEEGDKEMSTAEFEAIDPLGGVLHPNWKKRKAEEAARQKRSRTVRAFLHVKDWIRDYRDAFGEPNMTTGDTRLDVDPWEMANLSPLSDKQDENFERMVAAFQGVRPIETDFYDTSFSPKARDSNPNNQKQ